MAYEVIQIDERTWRIEDSGVRFFLLEGKKEALLIDSGMNTENAKEIAEGITKLPLKLLNTHSDSDHVAGNEAFGEFYMHPADGDHYFAQNKKGKLIPVHPGDVIDLGERELEILELPGHTPGSIAILDRKARVLIGGDSIQDGRIFMFGERRNIARYIESLEWLWNEQKDRFDVVYPSHASFPVKPSLIPKLIVAAKEIKEGKATGAVIDLWGQKVLYYDMGCAGFLCDYEA